MRWSGSNDLSSSSHATGTATGFTSIAGIENVTGGNGADSLTGDAQANVLDGNAGNDTLTGGAGNDTLIGNGGADTFVATIGDGNDALDGGGANDTYDLSATTAGATITTTGSTSAQTGIDTVAGIENFIGSQGNDSITVNAGVNVIDGQGGADTISTGGGADVVNGGAGNDTLNGEGGADAINGGADADVLIGGAAADTINTGVANDNVQDIVRFTATGDYGDTVTNFDADGATAADDRIEFSAALNTLFDDILNDDTFQFATGDGLNAVGATNVTTANVNTTFEALFLSGDNGEGVTASGLGNAATVAAEFAAEFALTAANGETTLLLINDTDGNSAAVWQWTQANGGEIAANELTLIAIVNANATVTTDNFAFIA